MAKDSWLSREWKDIKGNLKYDVYKFIALGAASMIAAFAVAIYKFSGASREWVEFGSIFAFSFALFVVGVRNIKPVASVSVPPNDTDT